MRSPEWNKMGVLVIPEGKTVVFRAAIFIGLATVVTTIIYFTPTPDQYPQSCSRPCHELDWPMICRVKLTLERYQTLGSPCKGCPANDTDCYRETCISVDGRAEGILASNRGFPGPTLQVCQHDIIVVDIVNRIPGQSFGVHWRGQLQSETPYMDGVPMITQCPIPSLTTFQYKFRASESGTHLWQVNTGEENLETLFGPLIVRKPESKEAHRKLYDTDDPANIVLIHAWNPRKSAFLFPDGATPLKLLINGKTQANGFPASVFNIVPEKSHRFRVAYVGGAQNCQIRVSVDNHQLLVIALDGHPVKPKTVTSARLYPGERLDFVLHANQPISSYYLRADPVESCSALVPTSAVVRYDGATDTPPDGARGNEAHPRASQIKELTTSNDEGCGGGQRSCLQDLHAVVPLPKELAKKPAAKFYFFYSSAAVSPQELVNTSFVVFEDVVKIPQVNNLTMMLPSSPLLSQGHQINAGELCNSESFPERCRNNEAGICECVHVVNVPLNAVVEFVLVNQDHTDHVFHLHGYNFRTVGASKLPSGDLKPELLKELDEKNKLIKRNFNFPVIKDTVGVASNEVVVLRFKADNPGYWLLDEEQASHWSRGMSLVLRVGKNSDLPPTPNNFPKCGDWIGPEFFLT